MQTARGNGKAERTQRGGSAATVADVQPTLLAKCVPGRCAVMF